MRIPETSFYLLLCTFPFFSAQVAHAQDPMIPQPPNFAERRWSTGTTLNDPRAKAVTPQVVMDGEGNATAVWLEDTSEPYADALHSASLAADSTTWTERTRIGEGLEPVYEFNDDGSNLELIAANHGVGVVWQEIRREPCPITAMFCTNVKFSFQVKGNPWIKPITLNQDSLVGKPKLLSKGDEIYIAWIEEGAKKSVKVAVFDTLRGEIKNTETLSDNAGDFVTLGVSGSSNIVAAWTGQGITFAEHDGKAWGSIKNDPRILPMIDTKFVALKDGTAKFLYVSLDAYNQKSLFAADYTKDGFGSVTELKFSSEELKAFRVSKDSKDSIDVLFLTGFRSDERKAYRTTFSNSGWSASWSAPMQVSGIFIEAFSISAYGDEVLSVCDGFGSSSTSWRSIHDYWQGGGAIEDFRSVSSALGSRRAVIVGETDGSYPSPVNAYVVDF